MAKYSAKKVYASVGLVVPKDKKVPDIPTGATAIHVPLVNPTSNRLEVPYKPSEIKSFKDITAKENYRDLQLRRKKQKEDYEKRLIDLTDPRLGGLHPVTGLLMDPNRDLYTGKYDPEMIKRAFSAAKQVSNETGTEISGWDLLATIFKETSGGQADPLLVGGSLGMVNDPEITSQTKNSFLQTGLALVKAKKNYRGTTERLGLTIPPGSEDEFMFQDYNGWGTVSRDSLKEQGYGEVNRWQGVDISENPLDMKTTRANGKNVVSLRNSLKQDIALQKLYNEVYGTVPKLRGGMTTAKVTSGTRWTIVKDLTGYPTHEQGGVDLQVGEKGITFKHKSGTDIHAKYGLYIPDKNLKEKK